MKSRVQANQLRTGDCFTATLTVALEVVRSESTPTTVSLRVKPIPCGQQCPDHCSCDFALFADRPGPYPLELNPKQRLHYLGNVPELLATIEMAQSRLQCLRADRPDLTLSQSPDTTVDRDE